MPTVCSICQETFYSDTEYREHKSLHLLEQLASRTSMSSDELARQLKFLSGELRMLIVRHIMKEDGVKLEEAITRYLAMGDTYNQILDVKRGGKNAP